MAALAQAGIVTTRRGGGGVAVLARAPGDIRLGEVVRLLSARVTPASRSTARATALPSRSGDRRSCSAPRPVRR